MNLLKFVLAAFLNLIALTKAIHALPQNTDVHGSPASVLNNEQIAPFVSWISQDMSATSCPEQRCSIIVMDFLFPNGKTSRSGMQSADALSSQLSSGVAVHSIDRSLLRSLLERDRVPAQFVGDLGAARWIGKQLNADIIALGDLSVKKDQAIEVSARLVKPDDLMQFPSRLGHA
jgi:hypothetical protein